MESVKVYVSRCSTLRERQTYQQLPVLILHRLCDFAHLGDRSGRAARPAASSPSTAIELPG